MPGTGLGFALLACSILPWVAMDLLLICLRLDLQDMDMMTQMPLASDGDTLVYLSRSPFTLQDLAKVTQEEASGDR